MPQQKRLVYLLLLVLAIAIPFILRSEYWMDLAVQAIILAMFTLSFDMIVSGMGQFSLGHQASLPSELILRLVII